MKHWRCIIGLHKLEPCLVGEPPHSDHWAVRLLAWAFMSRRWHCCRCGYVTHT